MRTTEYHKTLDIISDMKLFICYIATASGQRSFGVKGEKLLVKQQRLDARLPVPVGNASLASLERFHEAFAVAYCVGDNMAPNIGWRPSRVHADKGEVSTVAMDRR